MIEITAVEPRSNASSIQVLRVESESAIRSRFESYLHDESSFGPGSATTVLFPLTEAQVSLFLKELNANKIPVTISGARTGIVGGAVPIGGAIISLEKMNRVLGIRWNESAQEWTLICQPGIRLSELQEQLARKNFGNDTTNPVDSEWKDLSRFLRERATYFYAPDPTEESASLGGTVATDASGARTYFYGRTRAHVRAIRVVLATGDVLALRRGQNQVDSTMTIEIRHLDGSTKRVPLPTYTRPNVKCATGYFTREKMDLIDLFIGSEGTLGVITEIEIALTVAPAHVAMFLAFFPSQDAAIGFVQHVRSLRFTREPLTLHSMEYMDSNSLGLLRNLVEENQLPTGIRLPADKTGTAILSEFAYDDPTEAIRLLQAPLEKFGSSLETAVSGLEERDRKSLRTLRHAIPEAINKIVARRKSNIPGMHKISTDTAVPNNKLDFLVRQYTERLSASGLEHYMFGHIAENHLHVNIIPRNAEELPKAEKLAEELAREAVGMGGTVSAEHGIGKLKRKLLSIQYDQEAISQMLRTKIALDPNMIMCPGNIFTESEARSVAC
ncbi:MAG: FAD-binding oxidoreductase [Candidatus Bathyarchaeia archaeon]